jgi:hypothetical protein
MSLPSLSFDLGWAHVKFIDDTLNGFEGSMDWEKRDGDKRPYRFEAYYELETWKATISACDPENPNPFEDRNMGAAPFRPIKGLSKGDRRDIAKRAEDNAARLRKQVEEQRKMALGPLHRRDSHPPHGAPRSLCLGRRVAHLPQPHHA